MFITRLISGIILVALALLVNIIGGYLLFGTMLVISLIGVFEFNRAIGIEKELPGFISYGGVVFYYVMLLFNKADLIMLSLIVLLVVLLGAYVVTFPKYKSKDFISAFFGVIYVAVMMSCIYRVRILPDGQFLVWLIILSSWGCDTMAYCAGRLFGKRKLAPILSPKKSVEGGIGGVIGAALLGLIYALAINAFADPVISRIWQYPIICAAGAVISQFGDLAASGIKREHEIKDYGRLIPGHGGILDRFDSVIFTSPIIFYLSLWFLK